MTPSPVGNECGNTFTALPPVVPVGYVRVIRWVEEANDVAEQ